MILQNKDVLGLEELTAEEILGVLEMASRFRAVFDRPVRSVPIMRGRTVVNFFHEPGPVDFPEHEVPLLRAGQEDQHVHHSLQGDISVLRDG